MAAREFRFGMVHSGAPRTWDWPHYVREKEAMGYTALHMVDHVDGQLAPIPALAMAAGVSDRLMLGSLVCCNDFYNPIMLARDAATIDRLSGGRFELGVGAGWDPRDYRRAGVQLERPGLRIARLAESLQVMRHSFAGRPFTFDGVYHKADVDTVVVPAMRGRGPALTVGGGGPKILRLAGEHADIVSLNPRMRGDYKVGMFSAEDSTAGLSRKLDWVAEGAGARMDDIELSVTIYAMMVTNDADRAARLLARRASVDAEHVHESPHALIGTVDQIIDTLQRRRDQWGLSYVVADELIHRQMVPIVEKLAGR